MAISLPRISRSSSALIWLRSRPLNLIVPPTTRPFLPRSCITPSATVDLPQPDSPTRPTASPGMTETEKSITAGISRSRVKKEMDSVSISRIGPSYVSFMSSLPIGGALKTALVSLGRKYLGVRGRAPVQRSSIAQRFLAQTIGQQVEPQHHAQQRQGRHDRRM